MSGATVAVKLSKDASVRLAVSTSADLSSPTYSSSVATSSGVAKLSISGLSADTQYYYGIEIDGTLNTTTTGKFKTLPSGSAFSFTCAFSGDAKTNSNHASFDQVRAQSPLFFIHMGDANYENITSDGIGLYLAAYDRMFAQSKQAQLFREVPTVYVFDDHDFGPDNSYGASAGRDAAIRAYRRRVPHYTLELSGDTDAIYHSFEVGRVLFIVTDQRSESSNPADTDNSSKTVLGATQKAWFKSVLSDAANDGKLFVWVCSRCFGGVTTAGADHWGGYTTERTELCDYIQANCSGRLIVLSADRHSLAIDDGTNHDFVTTGSEPIPTFQAAPLDQTGATTYGGATYSESSFANNGQLGVMQITDAGGSTITVDWTGYDSAGTQLVTYQFTVTV